MFMIYINKFVGARIFAQARDTTKVADNGLPNYAINNDVKRVKKVENRVYLQTRNSGHILFQHLATKQAAASYF